MPIDCSAAALVASAKCLDCIPPEMEKSVELYLLAVLAGGSLDPATLVRQARCMTCIPPEMREAVQIMLLCNVATAAGA